MAKVEIKPLPLTRWHGKQGQESFAAAKTYEVLFDAEKGKYQTGLTPEEAKEYGAKLGVDLSDLFNPEAPHPFWGSKASWMVLPNHTKVLDTVKPQDYVLLKNMMASKFIANSLVDWEKGLYPEATHYIINEEAEVESKANKAQVRLKAVKLVADLTVDAKAQLILLINGKVVKGRSNDFVDVEMDDILTNKPAEIVKWVERGKEDVVALSTVLEGIQKGVLTKDGEQISYMGYSLGFGVEQAAEWFKKGEDQKTKVAILEKMNSK
jgi:hypothetical protein